MKYLCLVYFDEKAFYALPAAEIEARFAEGERCALELQRHTGFKAANALEPATTAATVRRRNGEISVTDGPFAETKEQLGGFVLIDAADLDEAIKIAARIPTVHFGTVEVRPVRELESTGNIR